MHSQNSSPSSCIAGQERCGCYPLLPRVEHSALKVSFGKLSQVSILTPPIHQQCPQDGSAWVARSSWALSKLTGRSTRPSAFDSHRGNKDHQRGCSTNSHTHYLCNLLPRCSFCSMSTLPTYRKAFPFAVLSVCSRIPTVGISISRSLQMSCPEFI